MTEKLQSTRLHKSFGQAIERLELWAKNPWRKTSLLLIVLLATFVVGGSIGMINGALALMDPVGALITVFVLEIMVRLRSKWPQARNNSVARQMLDMSRIGLLYGLLLEGFKLL